MRLYKLTLKMSELISSEFLKKKALIISELSFFWWTWRESNPRPNEEIISFLHAYLCLSFRATAEPKPSTIALSFKVSFSPQGRQELSPM